MDGSCCNPTTHDCDNDAMVVVGKSSLLLSPFASTSDNSSPCEECHDNPSSPDDNSPTTLVSDECNLACVSHLATANLSSVGDTHRGPLHEEYQYLELVREAIRCGTPRQDRTGVGTKAVFGRSCRFDLSSGRLPLLTTRRMFVRGIFEETLWFVRGQTDSKILEAEGVNIWKGNTSRSFFDQRADYWQKQGRPDLENSFRSRQEGDAGPMYGWLWRHFGAHYVGCDADYAGEGVDQLQRLVDTIKTNPNSRQMIMTSYDPCSVDQAALPPCHVLTHWYVLNGDASSSATDSKLRLCVHLFQRSCDLGLGFGFNVCQYALLCRMVAHVCGIEAGELVYTTSDTHVYLNHIPGLKEQIERKPFPFPALKFTRRVENMNDWKISDFVLEDYVCHGRIDLPMAV